jgi:hypothetical protein
MKPGRLVLRDARPADRQAVFEFTRKTWGDYGDFIPRVWSRWIRDRGGRFIAAELDGKAVGIAKITDFGGGEFWLEGLRVSPRHRHHGIARAINVEVLSSLARMKPRAVRYCTGYSNWASRHIGGVFGFEIAARLRFYWLKSRKGSLRGEFAKVAETREIYDFMRGSRYLRLTAGLVGEGWILRELSPERLRRRIKAREVMVVRRGGRLAGVGVYALGANDQDLTLGFVDGDPASIRLLARNCLYLGAARGVEACSISVPTRYFPRVLAAAGLKPDESMGQLVLQLTRPQALRKRARPRAGR